MEKKLNKYTNFHFLRKKFNIPDNDKSFFCLDYKARALLWEKKLKDEINEK